MKTIEYKVSFEKMISRIPGLFAYLESDEYGEVTLHKATDSLDGCWGKVVENIVLPTSLVVDDKVILKNNETYSFRTIIDYYYQYKDILESKYVVRNPEDNQGLESPITKEQYKALSKTDKGKYREEKDSFINFIEIGIGKIDVEFEGQTDATPKFIYLGNVKSLYNQLVKMDKMCDFYKDNLDRELTEKDKHLCCLC